MIKFSREKTHTTCLPLPSVLLRGREGRVREERDLNPRRDKYGERNNMSGRGERGRREEEKGEGERWGEQIKSCQMELLGFKRSVARRG